MKKFSDMRIGTRLMLGFAVIVVLMLVSMFITLAKVQEMNEATKMIAENRYPKIEKSLELRGSVSSVAIALRNVMLSDSDTDRKEQIAAISKIRGENRATYDELLLVIKRPKSKAALDLSVATEQRYVAGQEKLLSLVAAGDMPGAKMYLNTELRPLLVDYRKSLGELIEAQKDMMTESVVESEATYQLTIKLSIGITILLVLLSLVIAYCITRSITAPLEKAVRVADTVAGGDLTSIIDIRSKDEMGQLLSSLQKMNDGLASTVLQVRTATSAIGVASAEIASGTLDLSARTEQQASSLEETAASLEELTSTVKQNADNAQMADKLARSASDIAGKGGDVVAQVVSTMSSINNSSKRVADIISVIDGIAFQTNILALNAAVEAARAGEQGRGFAVVATEVRSLAQRSAAAAKEIKVLIDESVSQVDDGTALVAKAGETMKEIVQSIASVSSIISEISSASVEQRSGIEQINTAVTQMDNVTQQNAALVEEASAAAASMDSEAQGLAAAVAMFKVDAQATNPASNRTLANQRLLLDN